MNRCSELFIQSRKTALFEPFSKITQDSFVLRDYTKSPRMGAICKLSSNCAKHHCFSRLRKAPRMRPFCATIKHRVKGAFLASFWHNRPKRHCFRHFLKFLQNAFVLRDFTKSPRIGAFYQLLLNHPKQHRFRHFRKKHPECVRFARLYEIAPNEPV